MSKTPRPTRAELREQKATVPAEGWYGIDAEDAGASTWNGRFFIWATDADEAKVRVRKAGFHKKQIRSCWTPGRPPPDRHVPSGPECAFVGWYRSCADDDGWTPWVELPQEYRHPPQTFPSPHLRQEPFPRRPGRHSHEPH